MMEAATLPAPSAAAAEEPEVEAPQEPLPAPQDEVPAHEDPAYNGIRVYYTSGMFMDYAEQFLELETKVQEVAAYGGVLLKMQNVETGTIELVNLQNAERLQPIKLSTGVQS